jgi:hypothetical protein
VTIREIRILVINITTVANYQILQTQLCERSTKHTPNQTLVERMRTMVLRLTTINNILPFPLTVHATQDIMKLLHSKLLQGLLEDVLGLPDPKLLLHLLEEVRSMEPQHLLWIPGSTPLLRNLILPAVRGLQVLDPHLT